MAKTAFIALRSPNEIDLAHAIGRFSAKADAALILFEDGVLHAVHPSASGSISAAAGEILVSREDLEARGFSPSELKAGKAAEYGEIVDCIMERTERTVSV